MQSLTNTIIAGFKLAVEGLTQIKCQNDNDCKDLQNCFCHKDLKLCFCDPPTKQEFVAKVLINHLEGQNDSLFH